MAGRNAAPHQAEQRWERGACSFSLPRVSHIPGQCTIAGCPQAYASAVLPGRLVPMLTGL